RQDKYCYRKEPIRLGAADLVLPQVRLDWKPSSLTVHPVPRDADVTVRYGNGSPKAARADQALPVPIRTEAGRETVHVTVSANGYRREEQDVVLTAGKPEERTISLQPAR